MGMSCSNINRHSAVKLCLTSQRDNVPCCWESWKIWNSGKYVKEYLWFLYFIN